MTPTPDLVEQLLRISDAAYRLVGITYDDACIATARALGADALTLARRTFDDLAEPPTAPDPTPAWNRPLDGETRAAARAAGRGLPMPDGEDGLVWDDDYPAHLPDGQTWPDGTALGAWVPADAWATTEELP